MLTDRFSEALQLAERLHREQTRKGNDGIALWALSSNHVVVRSGAA